LVKKGFFFSFFFAFLPLGKKTFPGNFGGGARGPEILKGGGEKKQGVFWKNFFVWGGGGERGGCPV